MTQYDNYPTSVDFKYISIIRDFYGEGARKTAVYEVCTNTGKYDTKIGTIKWYPSWRCYSFFPESHTVYEKTCLQNIADFIIALMDLKKRGIEK
jgi:hypothetical protein